MALVTLKPKHEQRILAGHLWVYQGNVAEVDGEPSPGDIVDVRAANGDWLGRGYYNPHSQIVIRLLTRTDEPIDDAFLRNVSGGPGRGGHASCLAPPRTGSFTPKATCSRA